MTRKKAIKSKTKKKSKTEKSLDCPLKDAKGKKVGTVSLNAKVFDCEVNSALIHQAVKMYRGNKRAGTASAKTKGEVSGGGKKPWRQKGTGRARTGSIRNPLWRGGGIIFGPKPRDYTTTMPQKMKKGALKSSLNDKFLNDNMIIIDAIKMEEAKTKHFRSMLTSLGIKEWESAIIVMETVEKSARLASRNLPKVDVINGSNVNALDILNHKKLVIQEAALKKITKVLQ